MGRGACCTTHPRQKKEIAVCHGYPAAVAAGKPADLNPCVRVVIESAGAEEEDAPDGRHDTALAARHELEGLSIRPRELANGLEALGSSSEVHGFRVQLRLGLFVERRNLALAPHLWKRSVHTACSLSEPGPLPESSPPAVNSPRAWMDQWNYRSSTVEWRISKL
jgi:hypothetical protein